VCGDALLEGLVYGPFNKRTDLKIPQETTHTFYRRVEWTLLARRIDQVFEKSSRIFVVRNSGTRW
jgi:hypothetical protein